MSKVLKRLLVTVALLVLSVVGIGWLLPVSHVATVRTTIEAPAREVFDRVADFEAHPEWRSSVDRVEMLPARGRRPAWREVGSTGTLDMELTVSRPPTRMVSTILSEGMPFGGRWIIQVVESAGRTQVTITEQGEVYSPLFRFVSRFIMGHHGTATTYLEDLGRSFGEEVSVEVVD